MNRLYFIDSYRRYMSEENCTCYFNDYMFPNNPEIAEALRPIYSKTMIDQLWSHEIGRFDGDTVYKLYKSYIDSVLNYIDNNLFFHGDKISNVDFAVYGLLGSIYSIDLSYPNTIDYDGKLHRGEEVIQYLERFEEAIDKDREE